MALVPGRRWRQSVSGSVNTTESKGRPAVLTWRLLHPSRPAPCDPWHLGQCLFRHLLLYAICVWQRAVPQRMTLQPIAAVRQLSNRRHHLQLAEADVTALALNGQRGP